MLLIQTNHHVSKEFAEEKSHHQEHTEIPHHLFISCVQSLPYAHIASAKFDLHASRGSPLQSNIEEGTLDNSYLNTSAVFSKIPLAAVVKR
jgi:hypothetical protein